MVRGLLLLWGVCALTGCARLSDDVPVEQTDASNEVVHWTCPMHPSVEEAGQTPCPICRMDLTPVTRGDLESGAVVIDAVRRQHFGVRTHEVVLQPLVRRVRGAGTVTWDESRMFDMTIRAMGWVQQLKVYETGTMVKRGDAIAEVYSPDLYNAQRELLAHRASERAQEKKDQLELLGFQSSQIKALLNARIADEVVTLRSPVTGVITELNAVKGSHLMEGALLAQIAQTDPVWVEASFYAQDAGFVSEGSALEISVPGVEAQMSATVSRVEPWVDAGSRRMKVRAQVPNPDGVLLGNAVVDVAVLASLGEHLAVPVDSVIYAGERRIVFVDKGQDRLVPTQVQLGPRGGAFVAVTEGLQAGDVVVSSGVFLVAAESRLRAAETYWGADHAQD